MYPLVNYAHRLSGGPHAADDGGRICHLIPGGQVVVSAAAPVAVKAFCVEAGYAAEKEKEVYVPVCEGLVIQEVC